ncbi:MAG: oligosaccharide repeat unit polymerase family protein [Methanobacteriaceae archaeon]|jgi:oligosaccharide repeat unit polymerase|uniref:oligosaccharide repeat unit polymerase family protein n=1 Tax=Methanobrevibacter TaxID=2172 RepID=UPI002A10D4A9|nr:oligosaccharide repeat unit polymerase family protein [Methanobacteriaceae archaeon]MDD3408992.1 oligosaccharide repeat unit polymerase family protein [Methanobacteriaceae archaeon]
MSTIYNILTHITESITSKVKESFLFITIFNILKYFEDAWINSFFKSFYPKENFLSFFKKSKILNKYLFSPLIVIVVFTIFLLLSFTPVSWSLEINLLIAFLTFFIGAKLIPKYLLNKDIELFNFKRKEIYSIGFCLILLGLIFFILCIGKAGGLPIIHSSLRYKLSPALTMPIFLMIPGIGMIASCYLMDYKKNIISRTQVRFRFLILFMISAVIFLTLAYRTPLLAVLLLLIIMGYYGEILSLWEVVIAALIGIGAIVGIGYYRVIEEGTITKGASPISTLQSRADFTLHVLNLINSVSGDYGLLHGKLIASSLPGSALGPRMMIGKLIAWRSEVTVTPTIIGPMIVDFGRIGVAIGMGLIGFILGIGFKIVEKTKNSFYLFIYALLLTYTILGVETGILDIQVILYFIIGLFIYLVILIKNRKFKI